jgi:hypothetical protein
MQNIVAIRKGDVCPFNVKCNGSGDIICYTMASWSYHSTVESLVMDD